MFARKTIIVALTTLLLFTLTFTFSNVTEGGTSSPTISAVLSGSTTTSTIKLGSNPNPINTTVMIDFRIDNAVPFWGWSLATVAWNATVLQLIKVQEGHFLKDNTNSDPTSLVGNSPVEWNNTAGLIRGGLSDAILGDDVSTDSSGVLATLTFNITNYGNSPITLAGGYTVANYTQANTNQYPPTNITCNSGNVIISNSSPATSPAPTNTPNPALQNATLNVFTNKAGVSGSTETATYGPQDLIIISASLTYQKSAVANQEISFEIQNSQGTLVAIADSVTNQTGIAQIKYRLPSPDMNATQFVFGTWKITASLTVQQVAVSNTTTFNFNYLSNIESFKIPATIHKSQTMQIEINIDTGFFASPSSEFDVTVFDQANVPIASYTYANTLQIRNFTVVVATIAIPSWASTGQATACMCLLSSSGTALAPETIANFQIVP
ncbi:MAG: hypothetical protein ABSF65_04500 [Candidatus Bathyarchaeia archaeon]|jgi:hypothetical protein